MLNKEEIRQLVRGALERRHQAIVFYLAKQISGGIEKEDVLLETIDEPLDYDWEAIESLSQLRAKVGGRFQKLKERWLAAGFPLREHRGDRDGEVELVHEGWVELSLWIQRQGYKTRLAKEGDSWLFEIANNKKSQ